MDKWGMNQTEHFWRNEQWNSQCLEFYYRINEEYRGNGIQQTMSIIDLKKKSYGNDLHASVHYNSHCNVKVRVREKYTCTTLSFSKTP